MSDLNIPHMSLHKASDQAVVRLSGKDFYLGPWRSKAAKVEYDRVVSEWLAAGRQGTTCGFNGRTVAQVLAAFWTHAQTYYRRADGSPSTEVPNFKDALKFVRRLYGNALATDFGPLSLKAVREKMIETDWCRTHINRQVGRIKHAFRWAVENELIPASVYHGLQAVGGLKSGRSEARESKPVEPVAEEHVHAVLPFVSRQVGAMIQLQLLTGMRPGEVVMMRGMDIDMTGPLWLYRPGQHKTQHLGHKRIVYLGPKAKAIVQGFLKPNLGAYLFSPAEAEKERDTARHAQRKTPLSCGNRPGSNILRKPKRQPGERYTTGSYAVAIHYGCDIAFPLPESLRPRQDEDGRTETRSAWRARLTPEEKAQIRAYRKLHRWHPHQLRHTAATRIRATYGLEPAQAILGHKTLVATQIYAEKNVQMAMRLMAEVG